MRSRGGRCWKTEVTGLGEKRSERQTTGKEERWRRGRRGEKTREREEGTDSRDVVWSKSEPGTGSETETTSETLLSFQMCSWRPQMWRVVVQSSQSQLFSDSSLVLLCSAAGSLRDVSAPQSGSFFAMGLFYACSWSAGPHTAENLHSPR